MESMVNNMFDLALSRIPHISLREKILLQEKLDASFDLSLLSKKDIEHMLGRIMKDPFPEMKVVCDEACAIANIAEHRGVSWVSVSEKEYPPLLREMIDFPLVIYFRGILPNPDQMLIGMVGTRKPSAEALTQSYDFAKALGLAGVPVVSGLALGVDAMCHRGNLDGGAPTVAVLGSGVDMIYPAANKMIAAKILDRGGCILSEYAPGTKAARWTFPARNRIISGLSRGVIVMEAPIKSGALITAQFVLEQGKDLWVASSGLSEKYGEGTKKLCDDGAPILHDVQTLLAEWGIAVEEKLENKQSFTGKSLAAELAQSLNIKI
jgi:DNA processing protein